MRCHNLIPRTRVLPQNQIVSRLVKQTSCIFWYSKVHYLAHKIPPLFPVLNPLQSFPNYLKIYHYSNIFLLSICVFREVSLLQDLQLTRINFHNWLSLSAWLLHTHDYIHGQGIFFFFSFFRARQLMPRMHVSLRLIVQP